MKRVPFPARVTGWILRHRVVVLVLALLTAIPAAARTVHLYAGLHSELEELLPADSPAVAAVRTLRARIPGSQHLGVVVRGSPGEPAKLVTALAGRVAQYPAGLVRMVRVDVAEERQFLRDHSSLYLSLDDLRTIRERVERYIEAQVAHDTGFALDDESPHLDLSDIEARYPDVDPWKGRFADDRLVSKDGRVALLLIFVSSMDTGTSSLGPLMQRVRADVATLDAEAKGLEVGYAGDVAINVEELAALQSDLLVSTFLVIVLVMAAILYFYRWMWAVPVLGIPLLVGVLWGFGLASFRVTALSTSTAFLGSIVIGNGINAGIILLARYAEERAREDVRRAIIQAVSGTWRGTLAATLAAMAAYASLLATSFRGFHQFGVIGCLGMATCWIATYLLVPPLVSLLDRRDSSAVPRGQTSHVGSLIARRPRVILGAFAALIAMAAVEALRIDASRIEYDMSKLRRRDTEVRGEAYWSRQMDDLLGRNFTAIAFMAERASDAEAIVTRLREAVKDEPLKRAASAVVGPEDLLPTDQAAKLVELEALRERLTPGIMHNLPTEQRGKIEKFMRAGVHGEVHAAALPELLAQGLRERDGTFGRTVLMVQSLHGATWDGVLTIRASAALRELAATATPPAQLAGGFMVSSEILSVLRKEALPTTALSFFGVVLVTIIALRCVRSVALVLTALVSGVVLMAGALVVLGERINFLNFIAFPITFGIGVEYAVNVLVRYNANPQNIERVVRGTGGAVALCSLTTIIGYSSLLVAQNRALFSFGVLAVLGEMACALVAVLMLPAALQVLTKRALSSGPVTTPGV